MSNNVYTKTIDNHVLEAVTGGTGGEKPKPVIPNYGGTRYTADWWAKWNASQAGQR